MRVPTVAATLIALRLSPSWKPGRAAFWVYSRTYHTSLAAVNFSSVRLKPSHGLVTSRLWVEVSTVASVCARSSWKMICGTWPPGKRTPAAAVLPPVGVVLWAKLARSVGQICR